MPLFLSKESVSDGSSNEVFYGLCIPPFYVTWLEKGWKTYLALIIVVQQFLLAALWNTECDSLRKINVLSRMFLVFSPVFFKVQCVSLVLRQHTLAYETKRHVTAEKWTVHHGNDAKIRRQILLPPHGRGGDHLRQWAQHLIDKVNKC